MSALEDNAAAAREHVADLAPSAACNYIGGEWTACKASFEVHSPADGSVLALAARSTAAEVAAAAKAADEAFPSWRSASCAERSRLLREVADKIEQHADAIALVESIDTGQPLRFTRKAAARAAENFRFFADRALHARDGLSLPSEHHSNFTARVPIGVVGVITPWNTPFMLSTWKVAPALAAGCTVVHKPAEWAPLSAVLLADILGSVLPSGTYNMVQGIGEEAGVALTEDSRVRAVAFVGESSTGARIMAQAAPTLKRVHFELGGKNPVIVFEDADLDRATDAAIMMIYSLNGERCTSSSRLLAQESIYDDLVGRIAERAKRIKVGDPLDPATVIGPLIHPDHLAKVTGYFDVARKEGASVLAGGERLPGAGNYVPATLFGDVAPGMSVAQEEIFGPVLSAMRFADEQQAIAIANDTKYGLAAYIWTADGARGLRVADAIDAGMIWVNSDNVRHLPSPFGGMKASGIGRDGGDYSFEFCMEHKNICVADGTHSIPQLAGK